MSGSEIVQIVSLFLTATVTIVGLLVRARIIALEGEVAELSSTIQEANRMIISQGHTISSLNQELTMKRDSKHY